MNSSSTKNMNDVRANDYLFSGNDAYLETLFDDYLKNPASVPLAWRTYFDSIRNPQDRSHQDIRSHLSALAQRNASPISVNHNYSSTPSSSLAELKLLLNAYRDHGHFEAELDPLKLAKKRLIPALQPEAHGLNNENQTFNLQGMLDLQQATLSECITLFKQIYCGPVGFEFSHLNDQREREWLSERIEKNRGLFAFSSDIKKRILRGLTQAEGLEKYLGVKYVAQKRFSLEGGDVLIPVLDRLAWRARQEGVEEIVMGMAHRGRLNVLINILGKEPEQLFEEFEGTYKAIGSGDVKYHKGYAAEINTPYGPIHLAMGFNPSHLEFINPVIEGSVRSRQDRRDDQQKNKVLPVLIHGDAAFAGQGIVMETLAFSQTQGYGTGGTVHLVSNNQVGFTTDPKNARSSWYCTDIAKMIEAPVLHVNGDNPEAALFALELAFDFRMQFKKDVVIDLVTYRRHGHNEADEPAATQPLMYQIIKALPTVRQLYTNQLIQEGCITDIEAIRMMEEYRNQLDAGKTSVERNSPEKHALHLTDWTPYKNQSWRSEVKTGLPLETLKNIAERLEKLPSDLVLQPQVGKILEDRRKMRLEELPLNWGFAEILAYATLLEENFWVRLSGQDATRGTFFHRHALLHDFKNNKVYAPLAHIAETKNAYTGIDSILSESAVMGFEYGYATSDPNSLVLWEAQYGDFVNGAQVLVDQFLSSSEQKWGLLCGLVLLLPHGYEGAGPEHSSARLERFLQLCAEENLQVSIPTTPAQIFHLLRRQLLRPYRKPLVIMSPKSLLRHKLAVSSFSDLVHGEFQVIIPDNQQPATKKIRRLILCTGKIYYELIEQRDARKQTDIALVRIEQLYPFPDEELAALLKNYKNVKDIVWCQEEPKNQGAWSMLAPLLQTTLLSQQTLRYIGRQAAAAPAVGLTIKHNEQQKSVLMEALA